MKVGLAICSTVQIVSDEWSVPKSSSFWFLITSYQLGFPGCKNVFSSVFKKLFDWSFFKKYKFLNNYKAVMYSKKEYKCWRLCYTS